MRVTVVGGGLAGSECALQLAARGIGVDLWEQRPVHRSPAHKTDGFAELVCSNSLKSTNEDSAAGLLKSELSLYGSKLLEIAYATRVAAGGALAVDRTLFSQAVTRAIEGEPLIEVHRGEVTELPEGPAVIAAGPLCSDALFSALCARLGDDHLAFFDAAAPIVDASTIDMSRAFRQSRYDDAAASGGDYLNCPLERDEYEAFVTELVGAERVLSRDFESKDLFQACQPVEEVARTGFMSLAFGALKPVGLIDPRTGRRPFAVVQLRAENSSCTAYNLVGVQTNLTFGEQARVFRMIPALAHAEFFRYGVMHRNSFVDAPRVLDRTFAIPGSDITLAGQITGTEGYVEAIASGLLAALNTYARIRDLPAAVLPPTTAFGALAAYATDLATEDYQPMHVNYGIIPPLDVHIRSKADRKRAYASRGRDAAACFVSERTDLFAEALS